MPKAKNKKNQHSAMDKVVPQMASTPTLAIHTNPFNILHTEEAESVSTANSSFTGRTLPLLPDEQPTPQCPIVKDVDKLSETQRLFLMLQFSEQMGLNGADILSTASSAPTTSQSRPIGAKAKTTGAAAAATAAAAKAAAATASATAAGATAAVATAAAATATPSEAGLAGAPANKKQRTQSLADNRGRSNSRKREREENTAATDHQKRQKQISASGGKFENVFLTGFKPEIIKNGIVFQREFDKAVPNIKLSYVNITRAGTVIAAPATPEDFSRLMKEDWAKHTTLGDVKASTSKNKKVEYKAVVTGVSPELDDDDLKTELEARNGLKLTNIARLVNKESRTKTYKVIVCLENEETQKRVLKEGVYLGYQLHRCIAAQERQRGEPGNSISQCFKCQKWNPDHTSAQCKGKRACLWCGADHFHKECPHFKAKDRTNAKCVNCNKAHPSWTKSCAVFIAASNDAPKVTASKIVSSASISRAETETAIQSAMAKLWENLAVVISLSVSRTVLDLESERKKGKVNLADLVLRTSVNTVRAMKECGLPHPSGTTEVTGMKQKVWKNIFPQDEFPLPSQASSTPHSSMEDDS